MKASVKWAGVALFLATIVLAALVSRNSGQAYVYVYLGDSRSPSAVPRGSDLTRFAGAELTKKIHERLIGDARLLKGDYGIGIELGQFVTENSRGQKVLACLRYQKIQLEFVGEGVASNGLLPTMWVEGDCEVSDKNVSRMRPIWVPVTLLQKEAAGNKEISYFDEEPVSLRFANMNGEWPRHWVLNSLRLSSGADQPDDLVITKEQVRRASTRSIILEWSAP